MKKILLVDNVKAVLDDEVGFLNRKAFHVFTATSGEEALEIHKREKLDAIVMDMYMKGLYGDQVCRIIRRDPELRKVAILLAVLDDSEEVLDLVNQAGADGHIKKPIESEALNSMLARALNVPTRQNIRILVRIKMDGLIDNEFFMANTVDVSESGLLFECDRNIKVSDRVETSFFLPGPSGFNRVVAKSEVMRVMAGSDGQGVKCGSRFIEFKEGGPDIIARYVADKTSKACKA